LKDKVISIESIGGPYQNVLNRIMRMVPDRDKHDIDLQRLLAFRLRLDGEGQTSEYLMRKIRDMIQCAYHGRLYDFLKDDEMERNCQADEPSTDPPEIA
jgi:hypothetical protein